MTAKSQILPDRYQGCLLGLAAGDAVGTTLEFTVRDSAQPIVDMVGGGPFGLNPGEWTDDTSMALCLATSLVCSKGFDPKDQMNRYCNWADYGYLSSNGRCFDIGNTVSQALSRYRDTGEPYAGSTDPQSAGNGSVMRLAPVVLYFYPDQQRINQFARASSRTTHGATECIEGCALFAELLARALSGCRREEILQPVVTSFSSQKIEQIAQMGFIGKTRSQIFGSGYVVHCIEAAVWCFAQTQTYREAVLLAANLGDDADTTAAVCGQLAGAFYGRSGIPDSWLTQLVMFQEIIDLADQLYAGPA